MSSVDALTSAIRLALERNQTVADRIGAARKKAEELRDQLAAMGVEEKSRQVNAVAAELETQQAQVAHIAVLAEAALAEAERLRSDDDSPSAPIPAGSATSTTAPGAASGPSTTRPSMPPDPNRKPLGPPEKPHGKAAKIRAIELQNSVAELLAKLGYSIQQSPPPRGDKDPDFIIEGNWWDCYAPTSTKPSTVKTAIKKKVDDQQADRIVLVLTDSPLTPESIRDKLTRDPVNGLKEIKLVRGDAVYDFYPWEDQ